MNGLTIENYLQMKIMIQNYRDNFYSVKNHFQDDYISTVIILTLAIQIAQSLPNMILMYVRAHKIVKLYIVVIPCRYMIKQKMLVMIFIINVSQALILSEIMGAHNALKVIFCIIQYVKWSAQINILKCLIEHAEVVLIQAVYVQLII